MDAGKVAMMVLAKRRDKGPAVEMEDDSEAEMPSMEEIAGDLLSAIERKDKAGVARALQASKVCDDDTDDEE